jgi:3-keto-5-aminohexanoate cleavage enzyme
VSHDPAVDLPLVIEAAVNGGTPKQRNPNVPRTPGEITADALACIRAGATVVHNHNDEANAGGATRHDHHPYAEAWSPVLAREPDVLLYPTMAGGDGGRTPIEDRYAHLVALHAGGTLPMALADPGTVNLTVVGDDATVWPSPLVYENTAADTAWMFRWCKEAGVPVSVTIFEPGFLRLALAHHAAGTLPERAVLGLCFGGERVPIGLPPTEQSLDVYLAMLDGTALPWTVRVIGGDVVGCGLAHAAIERGGHVRVGLEDWSGAGHPSNGHLVEQVAGLGRALGRPPATAAGVREVLWGERTIR